MNVFDRHARGAIILHKAPGERVRFIGRVIKHLYLKQVPGIVDLACFLDKALYDVLLVVNRELDGNPGQIRESLSGMGPQRLAVFPIPADHFIAMQPVTGKDDEDGEVGDEDRPVEENQMMDTREGVVEQPVDQPAGRERHASGEKKRGYNGTHDHWFVSVTRSRATAYHYTVLACAADYATESVLIRIAPPQPPSTTSNRSGAGQRIYYM